MAKNKDSEKNQYKKVKERLGGSAPKNGGKGQGPKKPYNFYWIYAVVLVVLVAVNVFNVSSGLVNTTYSDFKEMAESGDVRKVVVFNEKTAEVTLTKEALEKEKYKKKIKPPLIGGVNTGPHYTFNLPPGKDVVSEELERFRSESKIETVDYQTREDWGKDLIQWLLFLGIIIAFWVIIMRRVSGGGGPGGQIFNFGKSRAQVFEKGKSTNVTFADVAGLDEAKEEVQEIVEFLKNPKKYTDLGAKIPKGALLVGPPGTGKTLLAKAVAGEAKVPFFSLSGSDFVEMFVGVGASRVRDLFKQAKEKAPCIIFIDEIDAIGRARGKNVNVGSNDERENTLNQLLTEMDGFGTNSGVILLAATNRADVLDRALLRAGRFDRQIYVDMPDLNERKSIFKVHLRPIKVSEEVDVNFLAKQTPGFSGADIANVCNEAALIGARRNKKLVDKQDFLDAVDRIIGGLEKKNKIITPKEKETIAFHEAGHATVSWLLEHASPLVKVTIVPRGQSLGAAWYLPEERQITTRAQILDEMAAALGGRAAEDIVFGEISTGALSDLEKVTKQAYAMVKIYGLNDKIGNISFYDRQQEYQFQKPYSEETARVMDHEVHEIIEGQYKRAKDLLSKHQAELEKLAKKLLEKEVIFKEDLEEIFGKRPWQSSQDDADINGEKVVAVDQQGDKIAGKSKDNPEEESAAPVPKDDNTSTDQ
ncbi:ATP-dependent zinc metalloprotease FtsH [Luteibaculum oceani]|uniref:ATP-dependent zinc metalloprotease FtsH n=1 Tax=Luteibaculum oceani TaxID=1294296 RepID=A0A5C6VDI5_9FLAO|nr:ATP-dependent zinc metalloprotease FtsH [Luteibaculum oceani]TXC81745.1 ATP-dependent zinc metalloprotease FtsH [Luteibaculum oceani]